MTRYAHHSHGVPDTGTPRPIQPATGRLFFVVGASGVGKDSLLRWVERQIGAGDRIVCARRTITRHPDESEMHEPVDHATFRRLADEGHFAIFWQAHGLCYGVRRDICADLAAGRNVVVNGSRAYLPQLRRRFPDATVVWVEADAAVLRQRLLSRRRESGAVLAERLERAAQYTPPEDGHTVRLDNSGPLEIAGRRLLQMLRQR